METPTAATRLVVVTGSASGIGAATRKRLEHGRARVIGVDLRDAEVVGDLSEPADRQRVIAAVRDRVGGRLDGLVVCAGVGPHVQDSAAIVALNYFGAQQFLEGLRAALSAGVPSAAVAISSSSATLPGAESPLVDACLAGNEDEARRLARELATPQVYAGSKLALARWVRRQAPGAAWAGAGIRLNAVAPGAVQTPLLQGGLDHPRFGPAIRNFPIPLGGFGSPEHIAALIVFLLGPDAGFCCGSVVFADGGTDALVRPDTF